jgi:hypothetical protein
MIGKYVIIRTYSAGVHAGVLKSVDGKVVVLTDSRRIWRWAGAKTLSELAKFGPKLPEECKFATPLDQIMLTEAVEIIPCTTKGEASIRRVSEWK